MSISVSTSVYDLVSDVLNDNVNRDTVWQEISKVANGEEIDFDEDLNREVVEWDELHEAIYQMVVDVEIGLRTFNGSDIEPVLKSMMKSECFTLRDFYMVIIESIGTSLVE